MLVRVGKCFYSICGAREVKNYLMVCVCWFVCAQAPALELNELVYITESSASFNYVRHGRLQGPAVELLLAATAHAGSPVKRKDIQVQPWARAYRNARQGPNTVLFSTIRTPEREEIFKWVGPIGSERDVLIGLRSRHFEISSPNELKLYKTGAVRDDVGEEILLELGVSPKNIVLTSHVNNLAKMLSASRIDLWMFGEEGWRETLKTLGIESSMFEVVYRFERKEYYFALSPDVDASLAQQLQESVEYVLNIKPLQ